MKTKVIAPVSSVEGAMRVVDAGADELYCGVRLMGSKYLAYSGRPASCCISTFEELGQTVEYAHRHSATVSLTANLPFMADLITWPVRDFVKKSIDQGVDALIVADIGTLLMIGEMGVGLPVYASSFLVVRNYESVRFLSNLGVSRVIAPPDASIGEIKTLVEQCSADGIEVEAFAHGENCSNVGGNCYLLHSQRARSEAYEPFDTSTVAGIAEPETQHEDESLVSISKRIPCLFYFEVSEFDQKAEPKRIGNLPIMDAFSFCSMCRLPDLVAAGATGYKLVGRCQPVEFQERTTRVYRELLNLVENGAIAAFNDRIATLKEESPMLARLCQQKRCYYTPFFTTQGGGAI